MDDTTKSRTDSTASTTSTSSAVMGSGSAPGATPASPIGRRSSHGLFEGLTTQKRKEDPISIARRQSMSDQRQKPGFIGQMWNNWVHGS